MKNRTNVLLIVLPVLPMEDLKKSDSPTSQWATSITVPIGVLSIAAYTAKNSDTEFKILDLSVEIARHVDEFRSRKWDDFLKDRLLDLDMKSEPDIVGLSSLFNSQMGYMDSVSSMVKRLWPKTIVTAGGGLPSNLYREVFDTASAIDALAIGEGEVPFLGLVKSSNRMEFFETSRGWMTRKKIKAGTPPTMDVIQNLDEIPFLRYDLIDIEQYQERNRCHGERRPNSIAASIMTTRGCPGRCCFCAAHSVHGRKVRYHSPERILEDIRTLKSRYKANVMLIEDDNFMVNKKRCIKIMEAISKEGMMVEFPNGLSIGHLDRDIIDSMAKIKVDMAAVAVESGSNRVLNEIIHKPYKDLSKAREVISMLREKGIYIRSYFIIGLPGETKEEIFESVRFMKETGFNWVALMIASPVAGSELYEICKKDNLIMTDKLEDLHFGKCNIKLPHSTPQEMEQLRYLLNLEVNFVENYDLKNGKPELALIGFKDVLNRVENHALAYYYASMCYGMMDKKDLEEQHMKRYKEIVRSSATWAGYARHFNLPV